MKKRFLVFGSSLIGAGVLGGIGYGAGLLLGGLLGGGMLDLALGVMGLILGIALGGGLAASWAARRLGLGPRSAWLWLGAVLGVAVVMLLAEPLRLNQNSILLLVVVFLTPAAIHAALVKE